MAALIEAAERDPEVRHLHRRFSAERQVILVELLRGAVKHFERGAPRPMRP
jgi:hypothetical protein